MTRRSRALRGTLALTLLASVAGTAAPAGASPLPTDVPPVHQLRAETILPPGNSGFFTLEGQARFSATDDPASFGPHVDDERVPYWTGQYRPGSFVAPTGTPARPREGVRVYRDALGVAQVYGDTGADVWFGAGYAAGQDRLFLADAVRRMGRGTFGALVGPSGVPLDVAARTLTYSQAEYDAMFAALPQDSQDAVVGYAEGMDAWISEVRSDPALLPAEYVLLSTLPEAWTVTDTLAAGVLITRTVASAGGEEFDEIGQLRSLQAAFGDEAGLAAFTDLTWGDDRSAAATIPASEGEFSNDAVGPARREEVLAASAARALALPPGLAEGPGTGAFPEPAVPAGPAVPVDPALARAGLDGPALAARAVSSLTAFAGGLHGGSYQVAVSGSRTASGKPLLESAPQLGYTYPTLLWQVEVHGAGYHARGVSVPGLPTVGIGYGTRVAWALTTGYSKTIDSFIETTRRTGGRLEYLHDGTWKPADCRDETIAFRNEVQGAPVGPAVGSVTVEVCRTVHGPVVATDDGTGLARSVQLAMYRRELETVNGILAWNRATNLEEFAAGVAQVTWNENVMYADADGHIAYWHPGLFPARSPDADPRFPTPGDGSQDWRGLLPFSAMPQVVDPAQGFLANWNTKPSVGWTDTYVDSAAARPSGPASRNSNLVDQLAADDSVTFDELKAIDFRAGNLDTRLGPLRPLLTELQAEGGLADAEAAALSAVLGWDGTAYGPGADTSAGELTDPSVTDGTAPTVFRRLVDALRDEVLQDVPAPVVVAADTVQTHLWEATPADNLVLRILRPGYSSLTPTRDYLGGRSPVDAVRAALTTTVDGLLDELGADPAGWRDPHPRSVVSSLTGVIGPSLTMPFQDRGSWIHLVDFGVTGTDGGGGSGAPGAGAPGGGAGGGAPGSGAPGGGTAVVDPVTAGGGSGAGPAVLARTGGAGSTAVLAGLLVLGAVALRRRRSA